MLIRSLQTPEVTDVPDEKELNQPDHNGFTPLQNAARRGLIEDTFKLLSAGANTELTCDSKHEDAKKTAFELSKQYGHPLVSQILYLWFAKAKEPTNYLTKKATSGALFWVMRHHPKQKPEQPQRYHYMLSDGDLSGALELAAYQNNTGFIDHLLGYNAKHRYSSVIRTAAYWAATHDNEEYFKKLCVSDEDAVYALWQLQQDNKTAAFEKYLQIVTPSAREKFENELDDIISPTDTDKDYRLAYEAACKADKSSFKKFSGKLEKLYAVVCHSYAQGNFVAMQQCIEALSPEMMVKLTALIINRVVSRDDEDFTASFSKHDQQELMTFWLLANSIHPYFCLPLIKHDPKSKNENAARNDFIAEVWSQNGLMQFSMRRQLSVSAEYAQADEDLFIKLEKSYVFAFNNLISYLNSENLHPVYAQLLASSERDLQKRLSSIENIPAEIQQVLNESFKRLHFTIRCDKTDVDIDFKQLPNIVWIKIVREFLYGRPVKILKEEKVFESKLQSASEAEQDAKDDDSLQAVVADSVVSEVKEAKDDALQIVVADPIPRPRREREINDPCFFLPGLSSQLYLFSRGINKENEKDFYNKYQELVTQIAHDDDLLKSLDAEIERLAIFLQVIEDTLAHPDCCEGVPGGLRLNVLALLFIAVSFTAMGLWWQGKIVPEEAGITGEIVGAVATFLYCVFSPCSAKDPRESLLNRPLNFFGEDFRREAIATLAPAEIKPTDKLKDIRDLVTTRSNTQKGLQTQVSQDKRAKINTRSIYAKHLTVFAPPAVPLLAAPASLPLAERKEDVGASLDSDSKQQCAASSLSASSPSLFNERKESAGANRDLGNRPDALTIEIPDDSSISQPLLPNNPESARRSRFGRCSIM